ncbi:MAG: HD domain-containing protein [Clostridia bacterium]|nr:HD domain-containing protein [Clostridia bacterium]
MIYTDKTRKALSICYDAHKGAVDKSGVPYVFHPFHLAEQMKDEVMTIVALLHDVIEDTDYTEEMLREAGFGEKVLEALRLLTRSEDVVTEADYMAYVAKIRENPVARAVKIADLEHNSDLSRFSVVTQKEIKRAAKYQKALMLLK